MSEYTFWTPAWAEAVRESINRGPAPEDLERARRSAAYREAVEQGRQTVDGAFLLSLRDPSPGQPAHLVLRFDRGRCSAAQLAETLDSEPGSYRLVGSQDDWRGVVRDGDLLRSFMYRTVRLEAGDVVAFFRAISFYMEVVRSLSKVATRMPGGIAA